MKTIHVHLHNTRDSNEMQDLMRGLKNAELILKNEPDSEPAKQRVERYKLRIKMQVNKKTKDDNGFEQALQNALRAREETNACSNKLREFPRGAMGLTPDDVKNSPAYKKAKNDYNIAFEKEKQFNQILTRNFKKEYEQYVKAKRGY